LEFVSDFGFRISNLKIMKHFNKITIIGVGLIGGSIGLAIKKRGLAREVVGVFRRRSTLNKALKRRAIDKGTMDVKAGINGADLIILATPVSSIPRIAAIVIKYATRGAVITDTGSTKAWLVGKIEKMVRLRPSVFFVGSHPMAGSEKTSVEFAIDGLLEGAPCIVTKTAATDKAALGKITDFWKALGSKVSVTTPAIHDRSVSLVSHLPHLVAFSLAGAVPGKETAYAAEGFKDTTRIASSDPSIWADIFLTNRKEISRACRKFEKYYKDIKKALAKGSYAGVIRMLKTSKSKRDRFVYGKKT